MTTLKLGNNMPKDLVEALYKTATPSTKSLESEEYVELSDENEEQVHSVIIYKDNDSPDETDLEFAEFLADDQTEMVDKHSYFEQDDTYPPQIGESDHVKEQEDFSSDFDYQDDTTQEQGFQGTTETEIEEEKKDFVMLYKSRCLKCSYLIPGLINERYFDECHFNVGNVNCPAKNLRIIKQGINIEEQARKTALAWAEGNIKRLNLISTRLLKLDEFLVKKVMQRAKEKYQMLISGEQI